MNKKVLSETDICSKFITLAVTGAGMQQTLKYAATLDIPFVFSSNGDAFLFQDCTGQSGRTKRSTMSKTIKRDDGTEVELPAAVHEKQPVYTYPADTRHSPQQIVFN